MPDPTGRISHRDEFHRGMSWKTYCRVATTASVTIATALNAGDSIDGVTLAAGDRVLVKDQGTGSQNGIYIAGATPARAWDMDQDGTTSVPAEEVLGAIVHVIAGTANGGKLFRCTNTTAPTLGTTALGFEELADSALVAALEAIVTGYQAHGNTGATETFDAAIGWHSATLDANSTFIFTGATAGVVAGMVLELTQDGVGTRLVTWPGSVVWADGAPTLSTGAGETDVLTFFSRDGGTTWFGFPTGGSGSALTIEDEGTPLATAATSIDFVGAGVTASGAGAAKTVTILGGATASDTGIWRPVMDGAGNVVTDGATGEAIMAFS